MSVNETWSNGYSGKGVTIAIVDDGVEYTHPDLQANYVSIPEYKYRCTVTIATARIIMFRCCSRDEDIVTSAKLKHLCLMKIRH